MSTRRYSPVLTTFCLALVGLLSIGVGSAFAAAPSVTVGTPSGMTGTTVHLTGTVNPNGAPGAPATDWGIQYARASEPGVWNATAFGGEFAGSEAELKTPQPVGGTIEGLEPDTAYVVRVFAINQALEEANQIPEKPFSTLALAPSVDSESTSAVGSSTGTLEALVNPNNQDTKGYLQYSTSAAVNGSGSLVGATQVPAAPGVDLGSAYGDQLLSPAALTGLPAGSTYYYQAVATNATGTTYGAVQSVTTVPTPNTDPPTVVTATTATFNGHLTLEAVDTQYSFNYNVGGECTGGSSTPAADAGTGAGNAPQATNATGLLPNTQYTVCFVTSNAFGSEQGPPVTFTTPVGPPLIESESVANVSGNSATLEAEIDPSGGETTYHFEYGTNTSHSQSTPESASIGEDNTAHLATAHIQGLEAGTVYHYRVVATNSKSAPGGTPGLDQTFTTQPVATPFALPDGRQYELVSPANKDGGEVALEDGGLRSSMASLDGTKVAYLANMPFADPTANGTDVQVLSERSPRGWFSRNISPPHNGPTGAGNFGFTEFRAFSSDLSRSVVQPFGQTALSALALEGYEVDYLRDNADNSYQSLLMRSPEGLSFKQFNEESNAKFNGEIFKMQFAGATPDLSHIVLESRYGLTDNSGFVNEFFGNLYEWADGQLQLISVGPEGLPIGGARFIGISEDGSHFLFSSAASNGLFVRDLTTQTTISVGSIIAQGDPFHGVIGQEGSKVFFINQNPRQVYGFDLDSTSPDPVRVSNAPEEMEEILGVSSDGAYVYYMSSLEQGGDVYVAHDNGGMWTSTLIKSGGVERGYSAHAGPNPLIGGGRGFAEASVTSSGRYLAFTSGSDGEVYLYDASSNRLVCTSCDSTGAQPLGPSSLGFLSEEGRVFLNSDDALVAHDTNGLQDVYEWEPEGIGSCHGSPGCVSLISSGTGDGESTFLGASADGNDVFFMARDHLVRQDVDNSFDVYDAHVCTAAEPCPAVLASVLACTSSDACKAPPAPQPAVFGAPPTATFSGAGNVVSSPVSAKAKPKAKKKIVRCSKAKKLSHGKCVMRKAGSKRKAKAKKSSHNRRAK